MYLPGDFAEVINQLTEACHQTAKDHGFWDESHMTVSIDGCMGLQESRVPTEPWNFAEKIALIHSELSEALECHRAPMPTDF